MHRDEHASQWSDELRTPLEPQASGEPGHEKRRRICVLALRIDRDQAGDRDTCGARQQPKRISFPPQQRGRVRAPRLTKQPAKDEIPSRRSIAERHDMHRRCPAARQRLDGLHAIGPGHPCNPGQRALGWLHANNLAIDRSRPAPGHMTVRSAREAVSDGPGT